jgi:hypothetical protein
VDPDPESQNMTDLKYLVFQGAFSANDKKFPFPLPELDQNCRVPVLNLINNEKKKMKAILNNKTTTVNKSEKKQLPRGYLRRNKSRGFALVFNADPDPAFYLNADPDPYPDPRSQTNADPCGSGSWSDFKVTKS